MLLLVLIAFAPIFTLQTEVILNYDGFKSVATVPSASAAYTSASYVTSAATTTTNAQQQVQWPPTAVHNNWYILNAAANAAVSAVITTQADAARFNKQHRRQKTMTRDKQPHSTSRYTHDTPHAAQQQQNPVNYYTYNSSNSGNYRSPSPDMRFVAPYILAISNQRHSSMLSSERSRRREHSNGTTDKIVTNFNNREYVNTYTSNNNYHNKSVTQYNKYGDKEQATINKVNNADTIVTQPQHRALFALQDIESKSDEDGNEDGIGERSDADIEENAEIRSMESMILVPLGKALDKVRHFFEVFRRIISDDESDFASGDLVTLRSSDEAFANTASATLPQPASVDTVIPVGDNTHLSLEVQGQRSPPTAIDKPRLTAVTASTQATPIASAENSAISLTSTALAIGRGKKLKKKLKKFMLPLLLAYKLKFIALVPLLIGGLTLLVGSTGLAGFFFALFLTVMSLKGGGVNKSIAIKKVW